MPGAWSWISAVLITKPKTGPSVFKQPISLSVVTNVNDLISTVEQVVNAGADWIVRDLASVRALRTGKDGVTLEITNAYVP